MGGVCPKLYHKALRKTYCEQHAGYEKMYPAKLSQYRKKRYNEEELPAQILRTTPIPQENQRGTGKDVINISIAVKWSFFVLDPCVLRTGKVPVCLCPLHGRDMVPRGISTAFAFLFCRPELSRAP